MDYSKIPVDLKRRTQWVCHRFPNKMPLCPRPGPDGKLHPAKADNSLTWGTFEEATRVVAANNAAGIGFELGDGICGVDIDHCVEDGEPNEFAKSLIGWLQSYTEISPSGTGIHILCEGRLPEREGRRDSMLGLEMYDNARYFTVTGSVYCDEEGIPYPLRECSAELDAIHKTYLTHEEAKQTWLGENPDDVQAADGALETVPAASKNEVSGEKVRDFSDQEILDIAFRSRSGEEMKRLYDGDWDGSKYKSQSEADFAFASYLAFWFNCDTDRMDRVFRSSKLYRKKWDRSVGGGKTYGQYTLSHAIKGKDCTFIPVDRKLVREEIPLPDPPPEPGGDPPAPPPSFSMGKAAESEAIAKDPKRYTLDDTGNAYRFRDSYYMDVKYDHINQIWMIWTGQRWQEDQTGEIKRKADVLLENLWKEAGPEGDREANEPLRKHVRRTRSSKAKKAMIEETQHLPGIPILPNELDRYKDALNVRNGIVDLKTGKLRPHDRRLKMSLLADIDYVEGAECPLWHKFLNDITLWDEELQLYIQRMVGYFLTGSTAEQCLFFLYGTGSNGKSTFVNMVSSLFGDYTKNAQSETIMRVDRGNSSSARSDIARLKSVRLVTTSEPSGGCVLDEALVKTMTGEDVITARRLYREEFQFRPEFKIVMATNVKPIIKHSDHGIWRRVRMLPFEAQIPDSQKDIHLADKLQAEKVGIFQWALQGAVDWYREGMPSCKLVDDANNEYRMEMDKTKQFVEDCVVQETGCSIPSGKLYSVYRAWCSEHGERYPSSQSKFSLDLQDNYHFYKRKTARFNEFVDIALTETGNQFAMMAPASPQ